VKESASCSGLHRSGVEDLAALFAAAETARNPRHRKVLNDTLDKSLAILGFEVGFVRVLDADRKHMVCAPPAVCTP
jgi:hypothetical protein